MSYIAPSPLLPELEVSNPISWPTKRDFEFCFPVESSNLHYSHTSSSYIERGVNCDTVPRRSSSQGNFLHIDSFLIPTTSSGSVVSSDMDLEFLESTSESTDDSSCSELDFESLDEIPLEHEFMSDEAVALPLAERRSGLDHKQSFIRSSDSTSSSSNSQSPSPNRYGFHLDLSALTAAKPIARVVSHSEISINSYNNIVTQPQHISMSLIGMDTAAPYHHYHHHHDHHDHHHHHDQDHQYQQHSQTLIKSVSEFSIPKHRPASSSAPTPMFRKRQAALHRRLLERPSVDSLVQHNILFGPDLSPSLSAAARAFKWRRNSDELNHLLAKRASRDSLIQSNIIQLDTSQRQQRFKESQTALANILGQRSSVASLIQRNILQDPSLPSPSSETSSTNASPSPTPNSHTLSSSSSTLATNPSN